MTTRTLGGVKYERFSAMDLVWFENHELVPLDPPITTTSWRFASDSPAAFPLLDYGIAWYVVEDVPWKPGSDAAVSGHTAARVSVAFSVGDLERNPGVVHRDNLLYNKCASAWMCLQDLLHERSDAEWYAENIAGIKFPERSP